MGPAGGECHNAVMALRIDNESALNWTGVIIIVVVATLSLTDIARESGRVSLTTGIPALLFLTQLLAFLLRVSDWPEGGTHRARSLFLLQAVIIVALYLSVESPVIAILGIVWIVQATELYPRGAVTLLVAAVLVFGATRYLHWPDDPGSALANTVTLGVFHLFALITTQRFHREQYLREESATLNRELLATRELLASHSRQEERLRIARDLHDSLGHHMTALILQLEVATHRSAGEADRSIRQSLETAKHLLGELRAAVGELRDEDRIDLKAAVDRLLQNMPGLTVKCHYPETLHIREMKTAETLLRCIQEGLTNVARHSDADTVAVTLKDNGDGIHLWMKDNGRNPGHVTAGHGLTGMRERVIALGGRMEWQCTPDGFQLDIHLPARSDA